jgi:hypothetical protein
MRGFVRLGTAKHRRVRRGRRGAARRVKATHGMARQAGQRGAELGLAQRRPVRLGRAWLGRQGMAMLGAAGMARLGSVRQSLATHGKAGTARRCIAWFGAPKRGRASLGAARQARRGSVRYSAARRGTAWLGTAGAAGLAWQGGARFGKARRGAARQGRVWHGRQGSTWRGMSRFGTAWQSLAWHGRRGRVRLGGAQSGTAVQGSAWQAWQCSARRRLARLGAAGIGKAGAAWRSVVGPGRAGQGSAISLDKSPNHPTPTNGMSRFYDRAIWRRVRKRILARDGYRCVVCHAFVGMVGGARVDHILTLDRAPSRALDPTNLRTLCPVCDGQSGDKHQHHKTNPRVEAFNHGYDERGYPLTPSHGWSRAVERVAQP